MVVEIICSDWYPLLPELPQRSWVDYQLTIVHKQPRILLDGRFTQTFHYNGYTNTLLEDSGDGDGMDRMCASFIVIVYCTVNPTGDLSRHARSTVRGDYFLDE